MWAQEWLFQAHNLENFSLGLKCHHQQQAHLSQDQKHFIKMASIYNAKTSQLTHMNAN